MMQVLAMLKNAAHGLHNRLVVQFPAVESDQSRSPIQCFCYTRSLVEIHLANFLHESADLFRHVPLDLRELRSNDLVFLFEAGVFNPVIKAAALQRVMNFASSIRSQKDIGPMLRRDRA